MMAYGLLTGAGHPPIPPVSRYISDFLGGVTRSNNICMTAVLSEALV